MAYVSSPYCFEFSWILSSSLKPTRPITNAAARAFPGLPRMAPSSSPRKMRQVRPVQDVRSKSHMGLATGRSDTYRQSRGTGNRELAADRLTGSAASPLYWFLVRAVHMRFFVVPPPPPSESLVSDTSPPAASGVEAPLRSEANAKQLLIPGSGPPSRRLSAQYHHLFPRAPFRSPDHFPENPSGGLINVQTVKL